MGESIRQVSRGAEFETALRNGSVINPSEWVTETAAVAGISRDGIELEVVSAQSACGGCQAKSHCGQSAMSSALMPFLKPTTFRSLDIPFSCVPDNLWCDAPLDRQLKVGDTVVVGLPKQRLVQATFLVYLLPLLGAVLGTLCGDVVASRWHLSDASRDLISLLGAALGVFSVIVGLKWFNHHQKTHRSFEPIILQRLSS